MIQAHMCHFCWRPFWQLAALAVATLAMDRSMAQSGLDSLTAQSSSGQAVPDSRWPVPSSDAQQAAAVKLRDVFASEFTAAKTAEKKSSLAKSLAQQAAGATAPAERWAMLSEALRLATDGGDISTAMELLERIPREFAVAAGDTVQLEVLSKLATKAGPNSAEAVGGQILGHARRLGEAGSYTQASKAVSTVMTLARRVKNAELLAAATKLQADQKEEQKEAKNEAAIVEKIRKSPDDPEVCLEAGKFYCFKADDWRKGLPLLAAGSHPGLAQAAEAELASAGPGTPSTTLADRWWEVAENESGATKAAVQAHAADLYRYTLGSLSGLDKVRVEKRIAMAAASSKQAGTSLAKRIPGLVLWLDAAEPQSFEPPIRRGTDDIRISVWRDLSGQGNDAKQPVPAKQPLWSANGFDDTPGVLCSGGQTLAVQMPCGRTGTILVTLRPKVVGNMRPLGCYRNEGEHVGLCLRSDGSAWAEATMSGNAAAAVRPGVSIYRAESRLLLGQTWGKAVALIGGGAAASGPSATGADTFPGPWGVGGAILKQPIEYFTGSLGEILVYDRELSAAELQGLSGELAAKWRCP